MAKKYINVIACPNCKGYIGEIDINHQLLGFFCETCNLIYPVKEDILILLPESARNYALEYNLLQNLRKKLLNNSSDRLKQYIKITLELLASSRDMKSWEWEEEEHWRKVYENERMSLVEKNWNDRIWQREFLLKRLAKETKLTGKTILDIGCGEGKTFRMLLSPYCDESSLYVAADISLEGLKMNRMRNRHDNSLYVLCSADKLPFRSETIDVLCYFGIMQYTKAKAGALAEGVRVVKKGGYILCHEILTHARLSQLLPEFLRVLLPKTKTGVHRETLNKDELFAHISNDKNIEIIASRETSSLFFSYMIRFFRDFMLKSKALFLLFSKLDILFVRLFGSIIPHLFSPREIMLLLWKP